MSIEDLVTQKEQQKEIEKILPETQNDWLNLFIFLVVLSFVCRGFLWLVEEIEQWLT